MTKTPFNPWHVFSDMIDQLKIDMNNAEKKKFYNTYVKKQLLGFKFSNLSELKEYIFSRIDNFIQDRGLQTQEDFDIEKLLGRNEGMGMRRKPNKWVSFINKHKKFYNPKKETWGEFIHILSQKYHAQGH